MGLTAVLATLALAMLSQASIDPPRLPRIGQPAPDVQVSAVLGPASRPDFDVPGSVLPSLKGSVVVVNFFGTWCAPCVAAMPHIDSVVEAAAGEPVVFLSVSNEERTVVEKFLATHRSREIFAIDRDGRTFENYMIRSLPFAVIIGPDGRISSFTSPDRLNLEQIRRALTSARSSGSGDSR